jgi:hypothetical protein
MTSLRWSVTDFLPRFNPRVVRIEVVVDRVWLQRLYSEHFGFPVLVIIPLLLHTYSSRSWYSKPTWGCCLISLTWVSCNGLHYRISSKFNGVFRNRQSSETECAYNIFFQFGLTHCFPNFFLHYPKPLIRKSFLPNVGKTLTAQKTYLTSEERLVKNRKQTLCLMQCFYFKHL